VSPRCIVHRTGPVPHGIAGEKSSPIEIEGIAENGSVGALLGKRDPLAPSRVRYAKPADPATLHRDCRDSMIVAHIEHQGKLET